MLLLLMVNGEVTLAGLLVLKIEPSEFLHVLAGIYFGREDVSLRVNGNVVQSHKMRVQRPPNRYEVSI